MKNNILVITDSLDTHADILCPKIKEAGSNVFRLDTNNSDQYVASLKPEQSLLRLVDKESGHEVFGENIGSVWYRRPSPDTSLEEGLDNVSKKFVRSETKQWVKSLALALKDSFWVSPPLSLYVARVKAHQLFVASKYDLTVPKTLITRDVQEIRDFFDQCSAGMISKSIRAPFVESEHSYHVLRTQEITREDLEDPSLYVCPAIFQEKIDVAHELRIVVIGRKIFSFKLKPQNSGTLDIRSGKIEDIEHSICDISQDLEKKILNMMDYLNIPFSSMDFLVDNKGREFFIDLNPNGQWLWLEILTKTVEMSDTFINMLISRKMPV